MIHINKYRLLYYYLLKLLKLNSDKLEIYPDKKGFIGVLINESNYILRQIEDPEDIEIFNNQRTNVFINELSWSVNLENQSKVDIDIYDERCVYYGLYKDKELIGGFRIIISNDFQDTMIKKSFGIILDNHYIIKDKYILEISRLLLNKDYRKASLYNGLPISFLLYKAIYHWLINNNINYCYIMTNLRYYNNLSKIVALTSCKTYKSTDSSEYVVAIIDANATANKIHKLSTIVHNWMTNNK